MFGIHIAFSQFGLPETGSRRCRDGHGQVQRTARAGFPAVVAKSTGRRPSLRYAVVKVLDNTKKAINLKLQLGRLLVLSKFAVSSNLSPFLIGYLILAQNSEKCKYFFKFF